MSAVDMNRVVAVLNDWSSGQRDQRTPAMRINSFAGRIALLWPQWLPSCTMATGQIYPHLFFRPTK